MQARTSNTDLITRLRSALDGRVIAPDDTGYDQARTVFFGGFDGHPAVIARPANDADVSRIVTIARDSDVALSVRSGGHSFAGHSAIDGGVVLDLRDLHELAIDAESRTAWAQTGLTAGAYVTATAEYGLATGFGDSGSVGTGGITLAGGDGFLSRKYGLTIDEVLAADIVTADGRLLRLDAGNHPELFWAIRGGGGNFGVVTRFKYRLRDVTQFVGGALILPAMPEVITRFVDEAAAAPDELSTIMSVMMAPPAPSIPPEVHGKLVVFAVLAYAGPADAGERAIAPFRAIAKPISDMVGPKPYTDMYPAESESVHPIGSGRSMFVDVVDTAFAETVIEQLRASTAMMSAVELRVLGGAISRVPADATAFAHRNRRVMLTITAAFRRPEDGPEQNAWVARLGGMLRQGPGVYVGFLGNEGEDRVREAYPGATWNRLAAVKRRYDPTNLFRRNQNIAVVDSFAGRRERLADAA